MKLCYRGERVAQCRCTLYFDPSKEVSHPGSHLQKFQLVLQTPYPEPLFCPQFKVPAATSAIITNGAATSTWEIVSHLEFNVLVKYSGKSSDVHVLEVNVLLECTGKSFHVGDTFLMTDLARTHGYCDWNHYE